MARSDAGAQVAWRLPAERLSDSDCWHRGAARALALILAMSAWPLAGAAAAESQLFGVLRAWAQSDTSFAADVRWTRTDGADHDEHAKDYEGFVEWMESTGDKDLAKSARKNLSFVQGLLGEQTDYYRYLSRGSRFRTELFRDGVPEASSVPREIEAHTGERERLSQRAVGMGQLHWGEFFQTIMDPAMTKELTLPHPPTKEEMPVLELSTAPWKDSGMGLYRVRMWFDRRRGYRLARLECSELEPDLVRGGYQYLRHLVVDWSAPIALPNGTLFSTKAALRFYRASSAPVPAERNAEQWPRRSHEIMVHHFEFSNVRVGEPLSDAQLAVTVPSGTNVIDNTAGYRYFAGSAGEQLQKSALTLRASEPGGLPERRWSGWRMWLLGLAVVVMLGGVGVALLRLRRAGRLGRRSA